MFKIRQTDGWSQAATIPASAFADAGNETAILCKYLKLNTSSLAFPLTANMVKHLCKAEFLLLRANINTEYATTTLQKWRDVTLDESFTHTFKRYWSRSGQLEI